MKPSILIVLLVLVFSCQEKDFEQEVIHQRYGNISGPVDIYYRGEELTAWKDQDGDYMIDGDIMLYKNEVRENGNTAVTGKSTNSDWDQIVPVNVKLWSSPEIGYIIGPGFSDVQRSEIKQAIQQWNSKTNVHFNEVSSNEKIYFKSVVSGCSAFIGSPGNDDVSTVKLSPTCDLQSVIHELGHVVGLIHEHQKITRDNYIDFKPETFDFIKQNYSTLYKSVIANLKRELSNLNDPFPFDVGSVMMYGSYPRNNITLRNDLISRNLPFYTKRGGSLLERPTAGLTQKDISLINQYYVRKLILKNEDYYTVRVKIRLEGASDPSIISLNSQDEIILKYDASKNKYTYNGYVVQQLSLNNGSQTTNNINLGWSNSNNITYFMSDNISNNGEDNGLNEGTTNILIKDYSHPANGAYYYFTNREGIDGGGKKAIIESIKKDDYSDYIYLKRWNSNAFTDGKLHSFDKHRPTQLIIRNINYPTLHNIIIKTEGCGYKSFPLEVGESVTIDYLANGFAYNGCKLLQVDLNNGWASDDLNFGQSLFSGEVTYQASYEYITTVIDSNSGYLYGTVDADGIDGKDVNAQLDAYMEQGKMYIDIKK